jgi:hypothetical protein
MLAKLFYKNQMKNTLGFMDFIVLFATTQLRVAQKQP